MISPSNKKIVSLHYLSKETPYKTS